MNNSWGSIKSTFDRIRILTLMQLKTVKKKKELTKGRKILSLVIDILLFVGLIAAVYFLLYLVVFLFSVTFFTDYRTLIVYLMIIQSISILTCSFGMMNSLFLSQDNILLLSFPCRHSEVFASKLLVYYVSEFKKNLYMFGAVMIAYGLRQSNGYFSSIYFVPWLWYLITVISIFLLPLIPVLIGSIMSLPLSQIKRLINKNSIFEGAALVVILVLVYSLVFFIVSKLPPSIAVITKYTTFINNIKNSIISISKYGLYTKWIVEAMGNISPVLNILWLFLIVIIGLALSILLIMPFFFKIVSHSMESASTFKHKSKNNQSKNIVFTFLKKEMKISLRSVGSIIINNLLVLVMPAIIILIVGIYSRMKIDPIGSKSFVAYFSMFFILALSLANNDDASTALTREGSEFVLIKTAPNKTNNVVWGKAICSYLIYIVFATFSFVLLFIGLKATNASYLVESVKILGNIRIPYVFFLYIVSLIMNFGLIFSSITYDLKNPHLQEYSATRSIKDNENASRSAGTSLILTLFSVIIFVVLSFTPLKSFSYLVIIAFAIIYTITSYISLRKYIFAFFDDIEV